MTNRAQDVRNWEFTGAVATLPPAGCGYDVKRTKPSVQLQREVCVDNSCPLLLF